MNAQNAASVRPRFGHVNRSDGGRLLVQFIETDDPGTFRPVDARDGKTSVTIGRSDVIHIDVLGPSQSIIIAGWGWEDA